MSTDNDFLDFSDLGIEFDDSPVEIETGAVTTEATTQVVQGDGLHNVTPQKGSASVEETINTDNLVEVDVIGESKPTLTEDATVNTKAGDPSPVRGNQIASDLAKAFVKDGILTATDEDISKVKTLSDFTELIKKTISTNEYSGLDDNGKQLIEAIRNGLPFERAVAIHNHTVALEKLEADAYTDDPADDDTVLEQKKGLRYTLIKNGYMSQGMDEARADKLAQRAFKLQEDAEDAAAMHEQLKQAAKAKLAEEATKANELRKQQEEKITALRKNVMGSKEILPGIPVDSKVAKEVADMITTPTGRDPKTNTVRWAVTDKRNSNPEMFDTRLAYLIKMGVFDEKPDLSIFNKVKTSSAIDMLEKSLGGKSIDLSGGGGFSALTVDPNEFDLLDNLKF